MGTMFGAVNMASTLGMAMGPWAGGWLYDAYASYFWLYIGSFGIGLGAVAIAFTFRPPREISIELPSPTSRKARSSQGRTVQAGAGSRLPRATRSPPLRANGSAMIGRLLSAPTAYPAGECFTHTQNVIRTLQTLFIRPRPQQIVQRYSPGISNQFGLRYESKLPSQTAAIELE
jgi:MFS family permease